MQAKDLARTQRLVTRLQHATTPSDRSYYYEQLYAATWHDLYYVALGLMGNPQDAEDVTQQAFLLIYRDIDQLKTPRAYPKWSYTIVVNAAHQALRPIVERNLNVLDDTASETALANLPAPNTPGIEDPATAAQNRDLSKAVFAHVQKLPLRQREAVLLHYYADLSPAQTAETLGLSTSAIRSRLAAARATLNQHFTSLGAALPLATLLKTHARTLQQTIPLPKWGSASQPEAFRASPAKSAELTRPHLTPKQWLAVGLAATAATVAVGVAAYHSVGTGPLTRPHTEVTPAPSKNLPTTDNATPSATVASTDTTVGAVSPPPAQVADSAGTAGDEDIAPTTNSATKREDKKGSTTTKKSTKTITMVEAPVKHPDPLVDDPIPPGPDEVLALSTHERAIGTTPAAWLDSAATASSYDPSEFTTFVTDAKLTSVAGIPAPYTLYYRNLYSNTLFVSTKSDKILRFALQKKTNTPDYQQVVTALWP
jgi:RNA polymerase sigma-70 factor (ECF subfamily)